MSYLDETTDFSSFDMLFGAEEPTPSEVGGFLFGPNGVIPGLGSFLGDVLPRPQTPGQQPVGFPGYSASAEEDALEQIADDLDEAEKAKKEAEAALAAEKANFWPKALLIGAVSLLLSAIAVSFLSGRGRGSLAYDGPDFDPDDFIDMGPGEEWLDDVDPGEDYEDTYLPLDVSRGYRGS